MIDDGHLLQAWTDQYAIKDIQHDASSVGARVNTKTMQRPPYTKPRTRTGASNNGHDNKQKYRQDYNNQHSQALPH